MLYARRLKQKETTFLHPRLVEIKKLTQNIKAIMIVHKNSLINATLAEGHETKRKMRETTNAN